MEPSFEEMYAAEFRRVFRMAYLIGGDRGAAEDAVQEAFARALERWERLRGQPWAAGWVATTAIRLARRAAGRRSRELSALVRRSPDTPDPAAGDPAAGSDLWRAVRRLPSRQQQAVVLRYVLDLPVEDVARAMGCAAGTVRVHLFRARRSLAEDLGRF